MKISKQLITELLNEGYDCYEVFYHQPTDKDLADAGCDIWIVTNRGYVAMNSQEIINYLN